MQIVAVVSPGSPAVKTFAVAHGVDPTVALWEKGWHLIRWLNTCLTSDDDVSITAQVRPVRPGLTAPTASIRGRDPELGPITVTPVVKQRLACYAIAVSPLGLLATRFSRSVGINITWGLPGGGRESGELPAETVMRELYEESGQTGQLSRLLDIRSDHWIGRSPTGIIEDFHALRLIYAVTVSSPTTPVVNDIGGTTAEARWIELDQWRSLPWTVGSRTILDEHLSNVLKENSA
ncbi:MAG: NUDIX hydrolase [Propionibacteriaceae bacterium]